MAKYHCPYCSPRYQIHEKRIDGVMVCGQCGDPLVRNYWLRPTQLVALCVAAAFISPLIMMLFAFFHEYKQPELKNRMSSSTSFTILNVDN